MTRCVHVVGAGLAGCEAAWQLSKAGHQVVLHEMRPSKMTPAHQTPDFAELVCSNSFKSTAEESATGRLKQEMMAMDSLIISAAFASSVPAGQALAVDRRKFSDLVKGRLTEQESLRVEIGEVHEIPSESELLADGSAMVLATGPLTTESLGKSVQLLSDSESKRDLFFYDAIAPILAADGIDMDRCFMADRWSDGEGDYLNIPLNKDEYLAFAEDVIAAEKMPLHDFESPKYFEACLPIEVLFERGIDTPRFGPMKPAGLVDPRTGRRPYANIQLRKENLGGSMYSMVGFQTKMKWPEQRRVLSKIPGLTAAEFYRLGSVHRNTYLDSPRILGKNLAFKRNSRVFAAGQITGVEGYLESAAVGLLAGRFAAESLGGYAFKVPPVGTVLGSLLDYVTQGPLGDFSPMNAHAGMLPTCPESTGRRLSKRDRKRLRCEAAAKLFREYIQSV